MLITQEPVRNYSKGRGGQKILAVVMHIMEGTMDGTLSHFRNPRSKASSHYGISRKGEIIQYVKEEDTAWHAGRVNRPTHPLVIEKGISPNLYTIGIEHEGFATQEPTPEMIRASAWLLMEISFRHGVDLSPARIINHREIASDKACPGKMTAEVVLAHILGKPKPGTRVYSPYYQDHLIVTRYEADGDWSFITETTLKSLGARAKTRFSEMEPERE